MRELQKDVFWQKTESVRSREDILDVFMQSTQHFGWGRIGEVTLDQEISNYFGYWITDRTKTFIEIQWQITASDVMMSLWSEATSTHAPNPSSIPKNKQTK